MQAARIALAFLIAGFASLPLAQTTAEKPFEPTVGQDGKDVVWVPTPQQVVDKMLEMAKLTKNDFLMDLGSGDGRTVITAAKRGARALGIEYNPNMVELSRRNAQAAGVADRAKFEQADLFETDFSKATVLTMFLLPDINLRLRPKILELKPGTRVVSNTFTMGEWEPDQKADLSGTCGASYCNPMMWIVPAKVAGSYKIPAGDLVLKQDFQMLSGTLKTEGKTVAVHGKVRGENVSFTANGRQYHGHLSGKQLVLGQH